MEPQRDESASKREPGPPDFRSFLRKVGAGPNRSKHLSLEEAKAAAAAILEGRATPGQAGGLLIAMRVNEECAEEIAGFALAIRQSCRPNPGIPPPVLDCAGAYDGRVRTLPVGVAAAILASRFGVNSLFHGTCGLGRSGITPESLLPALSQAGFRPGPGVVTFMDQEDYSPVLSALKPFRNELGLRTVFNSAEKLVGLAGESGAEHALLVGIFHGGYLERIAEAAVLAGHRRVFAIQGLEGSDDLPVTRDSRACEITNGLVIPWKIDLDALGIDQCPAAALECDGLSEAITRLSAALTGQPGPAMEALVLNAGLRLYLAGKAADLAGGVRMARERIQSSPGPTDE